MYPKLKVRSQDEDASYVVGISPPLPGLKALDSLFHGDFSSSVKKESKASSKKVEAEMASSCNVGSVMHLSASKESIDKNDNGGEEEMKPHIRASSIPRPRAVLSSPINDDMIGSKSEKRIPRRTSILKSHESAHKCNITKKHSVGGRPKSGLEVHEGAKLKSEIHHLGPKCEARVTNSAAERLQRVRKASEEGFTKKNIRVINKSGVKE